MAVFLCEFKTVTQGVVQALKEPELVTVNTLEHEGTAFVEGELEGDVPPRCIEL